MSNITTRTGANPWASITTTTAAPTTSSRTISTEHSNEPTSSTAPTTPGTDTAVASPAASARAALDAQATAAKNAGTRIVFDTSQSGRILDMSKLSPQELAAIANDKDHQFSKDESTWAQGELSGRVATALSPLESGDPSDLRAYQRGVKELYARMDPEVRRALGWTPDMIAMSDKLIDFSDKHHGRLSDEDFWRSFIEGQSLPGALQLNKIDTSA